MPTQDYQQEYFGVRLVGPIRFAIPLATVEAVLRVNPKDICPIPGLRPYMLGVISQKGSLVWVFNLGQFLNISQVLPTGVSFIVAILKSSVQDPAVSRRRRRVACVVSELEGIYTLTTDQLQPLPAQFNHRFRALFSALAYRSPQDVQSIPDPNLSTEPVRIAVLEPEALFEMLYRESATFQPALEASASSQETVLFS